MKLDLEELEREAKARLAISADIDMNADDVTVALIARIRELEAGQAQIARVFTGDVATARIVAAAVAFVDEQGKRVSIERGHTIGQAEDFAGEQFAELVRAVEAAGR